MNTSTHGIPGIVRSQTVLAYFAYPTQTSVSFTNQWPQPFPAVTICNYSPYLYDQFIRSYLNYTNTFNLTNTTNTSRDAFTPQQALYINDYLQYKLNGNESIDEIYFPLSSMLIKCVYNGANCSTADFVEFKSATYGLCYTFNAEASHINNGSIHYNNENGFSGKLHLDLYIHRHQYVPFISDAASIVTMIHDNTQLPLVDRLGIELVPGRKHKISYSTKNNVFLPSPYTTCTEKSNLGMQAMFNQFSGANYTYGQQICFQVANQIYTYEQCGCVSPRQWTTRYIVPLGTTDVIYASICNISDPCYSAATNRFRNSPSVTSKYAADCDLECSTNEFVIQVSSSSAPQQWYMNDIKQFVENSSNSLPMNWSTTWSTEIQSNYVGLDVVCGSTQVESYTQQATLQAVDVISNIGGQTGLWIGISFLSLMEFAEMLYRLLRYQLHYMQRKICRKMTEN
ncbi:hypothetical protein I4U23_020868 [Adineta vaga]|nr:hypothetical protein I4U23_020868 [Adineta vaga]